MAESVVGTLTFLARQNTNLTGQQSRLMARWNRRASPRASPLTSRNIATPVELLHVICRAVVTQFPAMVQFRLGLFELANAYRAAAQISLDSAVDAAYVAVQESRFSEPLNMPAVQTLEISLLNALLALQARLSALPVQAFNAQQQDAGEYPETDSS